MAASSIPKISPFLRKSMKLMFPKNSCVGAVSILFALLLATSVGVAAQTKKVAAAKKPTATTTAKLSKDANKQTPVKPKATTAKKTVAKETDARANTNTGKSKVIADPKAKKSVAESSARPASQDKKELPAKERARAEAQDKKNPNKAAESKRQAAELSRLEKERQAAALAERRRREEAAREALARRLAFERGLRTETVSNIAKDNTEGEDLAIRAEAIRALGSHAGSVVVMEAQTGKVLTIVNQDWAIRDSVKPCSTIKLVTGIAGLNEGVINKDGAIRDTPSRRDLDDALAYSDNPYFQRAGSIVGNGKMIEYARQLGLGQATGLNVEGETAGKLAIGNNNARIYSHGDDFEVSTLQLAVMVSAITNGGLRIIPRVPRNEIEKTKFQTFYRHKIELPRQNLRRVIPGMIGAAEYGTARRDMDMSLGVAGKTGSCISKGTWVGLFASVAPIEAPKYSVVVITRGQSERGRHAAAVASKIYNALSRNIVRTDRNMAQTEFKLQPRQGIKAAAAAVSDEDEDDVGEGLTNAAVAGDTGDSLRNSGADVAAPPVVNRVPIVNSDSKKLVTKTGNSKPTFPPVIITYDKDAKEAKRPGTKPE
ncbi:hypothetical protein BH20ACI2_BH20ACI2_03630 [soil metagenome]